MSDSFEQQHDNQFGGGAVLDAATIQGLRELGGDDDPGLVMELVEMYLDDASERMQTLAAAWDSGDLTTVSRAAHALKSASANIGALCFSTTCKEVELTAKSGARETAAAPVERCQGMFSEVQAALQAMRDGGQ